MLWGESKLRQSLICYLLFLYYNATGLHIFVLHMRLPNIYVGVASCSKYMKNFTLPSDIFDQTTYGFQISAFVQNVTCERYDIHYYIHIHIRENREDADKLFKIIKTFVMSEIESLNSLIDFLMQYKITRSNLSFRSTVSCPEESVIRHDYRTTWPTTLIGHSTHSEELCIGDNGKVIERECLGDFNTGAFWGPILGECVDVSSVLTVHFYNLSKIKITDYNILSTCLKMNSLTSNGEDLCFADIQFIAQVLRNMADIPDIQPEVFSSVVSTVEHVLSLKLLRIEDINSKSNVFCKILFAVENMLRNLDTNGRVYKAAGSNIAVSVFPYSANLTPTVAGGILESWNSNLTTLLNGTETTFNEVEAGILLPDNLMSNGWREIGEDLAIVIYKDFQQEENFEVVSPVISVSIRDKRIYDMDPKIEMVFRIPKMGQNTSYKCVFWNQSHDDKCGRWSSEGCISHYVDSTLVRCSCDRLGRFAVIKLQSSSVKRFEVHFNGPVLYFGWITAMFGLLIIMLTFVLFRKYRKKLKHKVLFNLSLSLFLYMLTITAGLEKRDSTVLGCAVEAVALHYFMLTSFAWILVEAFVLYHNLVKVLGTYIPRFMQKASLFAWGLPSLIVGITLSTDHIIYITKDEFCFPEAWVTDKSFYYGVAGPAVTMSAMTFVIFVLILRSTCERNKRGLRINQNKRKAKLARAQAILCVAILLGISWLYGVVNVYGNRLFIQYIYAAVFTLLGIFVFIYFVFLCKETRDLWLSVLPTPPPIRQYLALVYLCAQQSFQPAQGTAEKIEQSLYSRLSLRMRNALMSVNL